MENRFAPLQGYLGAAYPQLGEEYCLDIGDVLKFTKPKFVFIMIILVVFVSIPSVAMAHAQNGKIIGKYNSKVERWRPVVKKYLKHYHIYSVEKENRILNIIKHESGGSPHARNGRHAGLVQFTPCWKHNYGKSHFRKLGLTDYHSDNRLSGYWSIWRICKVYKDGGTSKVKQHWIATYNK